MLLAGQELNLIRDDGLWTSNSICPVSISTSSSFPIPRNHTRTKLRGHSLKYVMRSLLLDIAHATGIYIAQLNTCVYICSFFVKNCTVCTVQDQCIHNDQNEWSKIFKNSLLISVCIHLSTVFYTGGFKEGSQSHRKCRECMCNNDELQTFVSIVIYKLLSY